MTIDHAATVDRRTAREIDRLAQTTLFMSDDFKDRVNAFNEASRSQTSRVTENPT